MDQVTAPLPQLSELFHEHVGGVYNVAYRILWSRADAEDVVQQTFLRAFVRLEQLTERSKARSWLLTIAYRESIAVVRRRRDIPTEPASLPEAGNNSGDPALLAQHGALAERIDAAIQALPENLRSAVVLRDVEELPMAEVAEALGIGISAGKMRVARGREALRLSLQDEINDL